MTKEYDIVDSLQRSGYSEREASFLSLVASHSGYFLRRQFNHFVERERGAIAQHFIRKAKRLGHVRELPCGHGRSLFHLYARSVYRLLDEEDSQNRRTKSSREVLRRLLMLDYVLFNYKEESFFTTRAEQREYLSNLGVTDEALDRADEFGESLPVGVTGTKETPILQFAFIDEGLRSTSKFERYLDDHAALFLQLRNVRVIYTATDPRYFETVDPLFHRKFFDPSVHTRLCPRGVEDFLAWLQINKRAQVFHEQVPSEDVEFFFAGKRFYSSPDHRRMIENYNSGLTTTSRLRDFLQQRAPNIELLTDLITANYPLLLKPEVVYKAVEQQGEPGEQMLLFPK